MNAPRRFIPSPLSGVQSSPRIMRGAPVRRSSLVDVPLAERSLGSLSGNTLGDIDFDDGSITECMRPGEVMTAPGVCAPPGSVKPATTSVGTKPTTSAAGLVKKPGMPSTQLLVLGAISVGAILYFGRK